MTQMNAEQLAMSSKRGREGAGRPGDRGGLKGQAGWAVGVGLAGIVLAAAMMREYPEHSDGIIRLAVGAGLITVCWIFSTRHRMEWVVPVRRLERLIDDIRLGLSPIEDLKNVEGGLAGLARRADRLLRDLRHANQTIDGLNDEMRMRVAGRTSALERSIGALRQQANHDGLTGLYNRRMLDELLPRLIQQSREGNMSLSLVMMDIDHFKELNDTLGHAAGDEMLRNIGQIIRSAIREGDYGFRVGGDEFMVILPGCGAESAAIKAERMQGLVAGLSQLLKLPRAVRLSAGIADVSELTEATAENLIGRADMRLYAVKSSRRVIGAA